MKKKLLTLIVAFAVMITSFIPSAASAATLATVSYSIPASISVQEGGTATVKLTAPNDGNYYNVAWCNTNANVIKLSNVKSGNKYDTEARADVTGLKAGSASLIATVKVYSSKSSTSPISTYSLTSAVTVKMDPNTSIPLQSISLNCTSATLTKGSTKTLTVSYKPSNTTVNKSVSWSTSSSSVATVSGGKVTAKAPGTATITAKVSGKTATCKITVKPSEQYISCTEMYAKINKFRTTEGIWQWKADNKSKKYFNTKNTTKLKPLTRSASLESVAKLRAKEIATRFSHTRPNGRDYSTAYPCKTCGENIAKGQVTSEEVMVDWKEMNEKYAGQGHRRAMLNPNYTKVGVACYEKNGVKYWVQAFGN